MEWDHNPPLMKGASISYGTNYLFPHGSPQDRHGYLRRWLLTTITASTSGTTTRIWAAALPSASGYSSTGGDRATGGDSYEDTKASGHTDAPDFDSEIRNWEGKSMYSGFAFHRHLLTGRGRARRTMLTGDGIGQLASPPS